MTYRTPFAFLLGMGFIVLPFFAFSHIFTPAHAQSACKTEAECRDELAESDKRLRELDEEINRLGGELQKVGSEKNTLQSAINQLNLEKKKVEADISYTQNKIGATDLEISKLGLEINDTVDSIDQNKEAIMEVIRRINETDEDPLLISLLRHKNLAEFWDTIEQLLQIRTVMGNEVKSLVSHKMLLEIQRTDNAEKRAELIELREQYNDQNQVLTNNKATKDELLAKTKNEEALYQQQLAEKRAAREEIVKAMRAFEAQLQFILDPNTIPSSGTAVFDWPLANITITQYFGGTEFAKQNASVYAGRAYHPGIDLGAPRGTKIYAPLAGTVRATGNTDLVAGCYSWGKWTLIDHANGLSTLYAHQDVISVTPGQQVATGEVIGYTGNTGYSTGPHLHFTVYVKAGVSVRAFNEIKAVTSCGSATTPVAAIDAYVDPLNYLPAI